MSIMLYISSMAKRKTIARGKVVSKLDTVFSKYIRLRNAKDDLVECFTCGKQDEWKKMQCGHFRSRSHYSTRWNEINCQVQCVGCNMYKQGEQYIFGVKLDSKYGEGTANELLLKSKMIQKFTTQDLRDLIQVYQDKISKIK